MSRARASSPLARPAACPAAPAVSWVTCLLAILLEVSKVWTTPHAGRSAKWAPPAALGGFGLGSPGLAPASLSLRRNEGPRWWRPCGMATRPRWTPAEGGELPDELLRRSSPRRDASSQGSSPLQRDDRRPRGRRSRGRRPRGRGRGRRARHGG